MSRFGYKLYQRRESPYWWVYFTIRGKTIRKSTGVHLSNRGDADKKAAEILVASYQARDAPVPDAIRALSVAQLSTMWLEQLAHECEHKYVSRITTDMTEYIEKKWEHPTQITAEEWVLASYDRETRAAGYLHHSKGGPLRWGSIAHLASTLKQFLRFCAKKGAIPSVPELHSPPVKLVKADRAPRSALDESAQEKFLLALLDLGQLRAHRIYVTLFETWVRRSTLQAMTSRWIDWKAETITLPAQHNKTRREKVIDLTPRAGQAIQAQIAENAKRRPAGEPIILDEQIFGRFDFRYIFKNACGKAGIDGYGLTPHHTTRHSAMTCAGAKPEATLSGMMKQAGMDSTHHIENYLHPSLDAARAITRS